MPVHNAHMKSTVCINHIVYGRILYYSLYHLIFQFFSLFFRRDYYFILLAVSMSSSFQLDYTFVPFMFGVKWNCILQLLSMLSILVVNRCKQTIFTKNEWKKKTQTQTSCITRQWKNLFLNYEYRRNMT